MKIDPNGRPSRSSPRPSEGGRSPSLPAGEGKARANPPLARGALPRPARKHRGVLLVLWIFIVGMSPSVGTAKLVIDLDNPNLARMPIAVAPFVAHQPASLDGRDLARIVKSDLQLTALFQVVQVDPSISETNQGDPDFALWAKTGAQALITGSYTVQGDELILEAKLYDLALKRMELGKRFTGKVRDHRRIVHTFCDRVMEKLTGVPGCFSTRIAFAGAAQSREIFSMDIDGYDMQQLTRNGSLNLFPGWAPDGRSILFTSYLNGKPDLWSLELGSLRQMPVSARSGINTSGRYSPDGREIALSMNDKGIPKIFIISPQGNIIKRLTDGRGNDISPTWSPDRSSIAYVSDQAGTPQIYMVPVRGGPPTRLTLDRDYNTDPDWSPRGDLLAFTSRIGGRFQICTIRIDGTDFKVLTDQGTNQAPAWSRDGRMIAFTSNRDGTRRIYIMDMRGQVQVPVSPIPGKSPAWSPSSG